MIYFIVLLFLIILGIFFKLPANLYYLLSGLLLITHPLLLSKNEGQIVFHISNLIFLMIISGLIINFLNKKDSLKKWRVVNDYFNVYFKNILGVFLSLIISFFIPVSFYNSLFLWLLFSIFIIRSRIDTFTWLALLSFLAIPIFSLFNFSLSRAAAEWVFNFLLIYFFFQIIKFFRT